MSLDSVFSLGCSDLHFQFYLVSVLLQANLKTFFRQKLAADLINFITALFSFVLPLIRIAVVFVAILMICDAVYFVMFATVAISVLDANIEVIVPVLIIHVTVIIVVFPMFCLFDFHLAILFVCCLSMNDPTNLFGGISKALLPYYCWMELVVNLSLVPCSAILYFFCH